MFSPVFVWNRALIRNRDLVNQKKSGPGVSPESVVVRFLSYYSSYQVCLSREGKRSSRCPVAVFGAKRRMIDHL